MQYMKKGGRGGSGSQGGGVKRGGEGCRVAMQQRAKQASWQPESFPSIREQEGPAVWGAH